MIAAKMREPGEFEYFNSVIRPLLGPETVYLGDLNASEKYALIGEAVAPLNLIRGDESFGLVMADSLGAGTPVVAAPSGSVPEIIEDGCTGDLRIGTRELAKALSRVGELDRRLCRCTVVVALWS